MTTRYILFFILSFAVILIWSLLFMPQQPPPESPAEKDKAKEIGQTEEKPVEKVAEEEKATEITTVAERVEKFEEELISLKNDFADFVFTNRGASIKKIILETNQSSNNKKIIINGEDPVEFYESDLKSSFHPFAITSTEPSKFDLSHVQFDLKYQDNKKIVYEYIHNQQLKVTKTFIIDNDNYIINAEITFENLTDKSFSIPGYLLRAGTILPLDPKHRSISYIVEADNKVSLKPKPETSQKESVQSLQWAAVSNKYFGVVLKPTKILAEKVITDSYRIKDDSAKNKSSKQHNFCYSIGVTIPEFIISANGKRIHKYSLYAGPKEYERLKKLGYQRIMRFGWFSFIGVPFLWVLKFCYNNLFANYGVAILLLTVLIKIILYPLDQKSYKSMKEMQKIQPLIQQLKEKYKDDPRKAQIEQMRLFKEHKVNPLGGCLPLLLQFPVLIAMFTMLRNAIELRAAPFLLWIKDLSEPDALIKFNTKFLFFESLNILPILMAITFFIQQKMTTIGTKGKQDPQQRLMGNLMTIVFPLILYNLPSGLVLYFTFSTILRLIQQYMVQKKTEPEAVSQTAKIIVDSSSSTGHRKNLRYEKSKRKNRRN